MESKVVLFCVFYVASFWVFETNQQTISVPQLQSSEATSDKEESYLCAPAWQENERHVEPITLLKDRRQRDRTTFKDCWTKECLDRRRHLAHQRRLKEGQRKPRRRRYLDIYVCDERGRPLARLIEIDRNRFATFPCVGRCPPSSLGPVTPTTSDRPKKSDWEPRQLLLPRRAGTLGRISRYAREEEEIQSDSLRPIRLQNSGGHQPVGRKWTKERYPSSTGEHVVRHDSGDNYDRRRFEHPTKTYWNLPRQAAPTAPSVYDYYERQEQQKGYPIPRGNWERKNIVQTPKVVTGAPRPPTRPFFEDRRPLPPRPSQATRKQNAHVTLHATDHQSFEFPPRPGRSNATTENGAASNGTTDCGELCRCFLSLPYVTGLTWTVYFTRDYKMMLMTVMVLILFFTNCTLLTCIVRLFKRHRIGRDDDDDDVARNTMNDLRKTVQNLKGCQKKKLSRLMYKRLKEDDEMLDRYFDGIDSRFATTMDFPLLLSDLEPNLHLRRVVGIKDKKKSRFPWPFSRRPEKEEDGDPLAHQQNYRVELGNDGLQQFLYGKPLPSGNDDATQHGSQREETTPLLLPH